MNPTINAYLGDIRQALDDLAFNYREVLIKYLPARDHDGVVGYIEAIDTAHNGICDLLDSQDEMGEALADALANWPANRPDWDAAVNTVLVLHQMDRARHAQRAVKLIVAADDDAPVHGIERPVLIKTVDPELEALLEPEQVFQSQVVRALDELEAQGVVAPMPEAEPWIPTWIDAASALDRAEMLGRQAEAQRAEWQRLVGEATIARQMLDDINARMGRAPVEVGPFDDEGLPL